MPGTLRHAGILIEDIETARSEYEALGFKALEIETLRVLKMVDISGATIELVESNNGWHPHIAVNWFEDSSGNYIETVKNNEKICDVYDNCLYRVFRMENPR